MTRFLATAVAALSLWPGPPGVSAQEQEEILSYDTRVEIQDGGRMVVTEDITVRALGHEIRRGIYRDFPTNFPRANGFGRIQAPFDVLSVEREGRDEPWSIESIGGPGGRGGIRVRIGNANVLLENGVHRYRIRYETWRWLRFGETEDQLYWNVTGNGWGFPILRASALVMLPGAVPSAAVRLEGWTGPEGATDSRASWQWRAQEGVAFYETTDRLEPGEGFTIRLTFPTGVVAPPSADVQEAWFRMDWGGYLDAASVLGLVLSMYLLMWSRVGRDPPKGPLVVQYAPPEGLSPAALGYLKERGYDNKLLAATLVSLGVKGALSIEKTKKRWKLSRAPAPTHSVTSDERKVLNTLLGSRNSLELKSSHAATLQKGIKALKANLRLQLEKRYFVLNRRWFLGGLALSLVGFGALVWRDRYGIGAEAWFFALWLSFWSLGVGTLLFRAGQAWKAALGGAGPGSWAGAIFLSLFATPFVVAEVVVLGLMTVSVPQHLVVAAGGLGFLNVIFYHLLEQPTLSGRRVMDALDGFEAFLTATDADRLDRTLVPERTPELFERYLPHAIALGVENRWADGFTDSLAAGAAGAVAGASTGAGVLAWYSGGSTADLGSVATSLSGSFSSSLSTASSPPSSGGSGGGGGGGSSGGGGGGGGGGGW